MTVCDICGGAAIYSVETSVARKHIKADLPAPFTRLAIDACPQCEAIVTASISSYIEKLRNRKDSPCGSTEPST